MRTVSIRVRTIAVAGALAVAPLFALGGAAHASGCPAGDNPCDPIPTQIPPHPIVVPKPTVTFGCGTVTVSFDGVSKTAKVLPCPGPAIF